MSEHELEKLLGGFAADTLTPEEKQTLYTAALHDQELFNALADEQVLKELLSDPDVRRRLLASLEQSRAPNSGGSLSWLDWFRRPAGLALAGGLTTAALAVALGVRIYQDSRSQPKMRSPCPHPLRHLRHPSRRHLKLLRRRQKPARMSLQRLMSGEKARSSTNLPRQHSPRLLHRRMNGPPMSPKSI